MDVVSINGGGTRVELSRFGAMFAADFTINGRRFSPLFTPQWHGHYPEDAFLNNLHGDFLCAPFGARPASADQFAEDWRSCIERAQPDVFAHGYPAHHVWDIAHVCENEAVLTLHTHPRFLSITRCVHCADDGSVEVTDTLLSAADFQMPLGLHPIFALPQSVRQAELVLPQHAFAATFPAAVDTSSVFVQNARTDAHAVLCRDGRMLDVTSLPLSCGTEELLMLCNVADGVVTLCTPAQGCCVTLTWDAELLPNCLLWLSNCGRKFAPWNGQNLCLGIEPIAAAFDLGEAVSVGANPLSTRGIRTAVPFFRGVPVTLRHSLRVNAI